MLWIFCRKDFCDKLGYASDSNAYLPRKEVGNKHLCVYSCIAYSHKFPLLHTRNSLNKSAKLSQCWTVQ